MGSQSAGASGDLKRLQGYLKKLARLMPSLAAAPVRPVLGKTGQKKSRTRSSKALLNTTRSSISINLHPVANYKPCTCDDIGFFLHQVRSTEILPDGFYPRNLSVCPGPRQGQLFRRKRKGTKATVPQAFFNVQCPRRIYPQLSAIHAFSCQLPTPPLRIRIPIQ